MTVETRARLTDADRLHRWLNRSDGVGDLPEGHYAIHDPHEPERVTQWRVKNGTFSAHPVRVRVGPINTIDWGHVPPRRDHKAWAVFIHDLGDLQAAYLRRAQAAVEADPTQAAARFAAVTVRCAFCNRPLTDPESVGYGLGSDCRRWLPGWFKAAMADAVSTLRLSIEAS